MLHRFLAGAANAAGVLGARLRGSAIIEPLERRRLLSAGQLDPLFGNDGIVQLGGIVGNFSDVKVLPGGKFLAAGTAKAADGKLSLLLARFNANGRLDTSFGAGGEVITRAGGISYGWRLALLASGKFYVAGDALARFNSNGSLDTAFGSNGIVQYNDAIASVQSALAIQSDGKIVVMHGRVPDVTHGLGRDEGFDPSTPPQVAEAQVSRYTISGKLDTTFNQTGRVTNFAAGTSFTGGQGYVIPEDVAIANGKIMVAVSVRDPVLGGFAPGFGAERLNSDGSIDRTFGASGIGAVYYDEPTGDVVQGMKIAPNGTINLLGTEQDHDWDWVTLSANGKNGTWKRIVGNGDASDMAIQSNGKIVMTGARTIPEFEDGLGDVYAAYTLRLNPDGTQENFPTYDDSIIYNEGSGPAGALVFQDAYQPGGLDVDSQGNMIVSGLANGGQYIDLFSGSQHVGDLQLGTPELFHLFGGAAHAGAVLGTDHVLRVSGSDSADNIIVSRNGKSMNVAINGQQFGPFAAASIQGIHASGNSGDDVIHINAGNVPATIDGGLGNDQLFGGGGNNRLLGGPGNDQLTGGAGPNILFGGLGNDDLRPGVSPSNDVYGGDTPNDPAGTDTVDYSQHTHGVVIRIDGLRDSGASGEHDLIDPTITYVYGSQGNDIIFGGNGELKEALYGLGGSDTIYAGNGGSALYGGDGNDFLYARNSIADYLDGGAGTDSGHIDTLLDKTVSVEVFLP